MNWTFATNEENLGAPVWSQLYQHAGGVRSQGFSLDVDRWRRGLLEAEVPRFSSFVACVNTQAIPA